jgi:hypothetical protein
MNPVSIIDLAESIITAFTKKDVSLIGAAAKSLLTLVQTKQVQSLPREVEKALKIAVEAYEAEVREKLHQIISGEEPPGQG